MTESQTTPPSDPQGAGAQVPPPASAPQPPAPPAPPTAGVVPPASAPVPPPYTPAGSAPVTPSAPLPPASAPVPPAPASAPSAHAAPVAAPALDDGTYTAVRTPRSENALALDGTWHQISPRYVTSQIVQNILFIALIVAIAAVMSVAFGQVWAWIPAAVIVLITLITLFILPRQARAIGYMLREDDIVFRKGILWQRMVAVPYGRMQLVDISQGPVDRAFGISQLKMVTAAATTGVQIPGLAQAAAEALRDTLIEVAETRRTGL